MSAATKAAEQPLLEVIDLAAWYGAAQILFQVDVEANKNHEIQ